jgi:NifB/MoaA-like Fe-S oxidoreductase
LYGNFTTLTRFTEADLERVIEEGLSPLNVSIHATDAITRNDMLRNRRGGPSLRWLDALLEHGIEIHGQIVVCPDINNEEILEDTLCTIYERYLSLKSVCVVPLGVSRHSNEKRMRPHTKEEALSVLRIVEKWQEIIHKEVGRNIVHAADEYYLVAGQPIPGAGEYDNFEMYEDGVGIVRTFEREFVGEIDKPTNTAAGFFAWVDGAPPEGYRAIRNTAPNLVFRNRKNSPIGILTGEYGALVLQQLLEPFTRKDIRIITVKNHFFGGNVAVAGLLVGEDIAKALEKEPEGHRYLLPDVCLSQGKFLDGLEPADLPRQVEIISTDGIALKKALGVKHE